MPQPQSHFVTINDLRLHHLDWGTAGNPPLILCHGGSAYARWWDFIAPVFAEDFYVITPDWRGHGESQHAEPPAYSTRHYIDDLHKLVSNLGVERPILLGHSMGGHNTLIYAAQHADELSALILVDIEPGYPEAAVRLLRRMGEKPAKVFDSFQEAIARFRVFPRESLVSVDKLRYLASFAFKERSDGKWTSKFDRRTLFREPINGWPLLARITCPTLIVKAQHSPVLTPQKLERICAGLPDSRWAEVPDTHHHVMLDNPDGFTDVVQEFLHEVL